MNANHHVPNEVIEEDIKVGDVDDVGQEEEVPSEDTVVPPFDPILA